MLAAREAPVVMPAADYITLPTPGEIAQLTAVLQHYVADSKPGYFGEEWEKALLAP